MREWVCTAHATLTYHSPIKKKKAGVIACIYTPTKGMSAKMQ